MRRFLWIFSLALVVLLTGLAARLMGARTGLEIERDRIEIAWMKVERDLSRRAELLPQWLEAVAEWQRSASAVKPEKIQRTQEALREVSTADGREDLIDAHRKLESAVASLQSELQRHSAQRRNEEFLRLETQILAIENRIDLDRTEYNDAVQEFNTHLALFPGNLAARVFGLERYGSYIPTDGRAPSMSTAFTVVSTEPGK